MEVGSGCGWRCSTVAGWREKRKLLQAVGFLQPLRASQPLARLHPGPRNPSCLWKLVLSTLNLRPVCLNRGSLEKEKESLGVHTHTQLCLYTHLSTQTSSRLHAHSPGSPFAPLASVPHRVPSTVHKSCLLLSPTMCGLCH